MPTILEGNIYPVSAGEWIKDDLTCLFPTQQSYKAKVPSVCTVNIEIIVKDSIVLFKTIDLGS
jgi:hypothetical protein